MWEIVLCPSTLKEVRIPFIFKIKFKNVYFLT